MHMSFDVEETLANLTIQDKIKLLSGLGWWHTHNVPAAGVPSMRMSDGPNGIRGIRFFNGAPSNCFPSSTGLASAFDVRLARRVGEALGAEARAKSCHILLAPTVNTQRSPLGGRTFESFSEDPHLNGTIAAAYINGLQSKGVSATIKHFVANDQEFERHSISSEVSERALREVYLKPFQIALKKADPWAVMASYNRVNGIHASESKRLLDDILRKEWGFKGMIMSDWTGTYSTAEAIKAGLDLEMPGPTVVRGRAIERALNCQKLFTSDIDDRVRKILGLLEKAHRSGIPFDGPEELIDTPAQRKLMREAAADAIVLLKNTKSSLPLQNVKKIAVIGPNAKDAMTSGGGSAELLSAHTISPLQGITAAAKEIGVGVSYAVGVNVFKRPRLLDPYLTLPDGKPGGLLEFWNDRPSEDWLDLKPDFHAHLKPAVWSTTTKSTKCFLADGIDADKVIPDCWLRFTTKFTPDESGAWEFGLGVAESGNLFINGQLLIDLSTQHPVGETFFGIGTAELRAVAKGLKAGHSYDLELRMSNATFSTFGRSDFTCWGGFRLGALRKIEPEEAIAEAVELATKADVTVLVVGLNCDWESEGFDRPDLELPGDTNRLVSEILKASPKTIIVNQSGSPVSMPWIDQAGAVLQAFYGGDELGNGLADVLFGKVNPSGKLPLTFPKRIEDTPPYPSYSDKGEELGKIIYNEGIFVGYRSYDVRSVQPLFPFGYGLSYTYFTYSDLSISPVSPELGFTVTFSVQNVGKTAGKESTQIYITDIKSSLPRPVKELKGFVKIEFGAGERKQICVDLDREAFAFYDDRQQNWVAEKGKFKVLVAASSTDIRLEGEVELDKTVTWTGL